MIPTTHEEAQRLTASHAIHIRRAAHEVRQCRAQLAQAEERLRKLEDEAEVLAVFAGILRVRGSQNSQELA